MEKTVESLKKRVHELEKERSILLSMLDLIPGYVYLQAKDYSIPYTNAEYTRLFGKVGGQPCYKAVLGRDEPCDICPTFSVFSSRKEQSWRWTSQQGHTYIISDRLLPGQNDPELILEIGINTTQLNQADEKLQKIAGCVDRISIVDQEPAD
ncbi:MAG: hypothetical protein ABIK68_00790 [bacterium]